MTSLMTSTTTSFVHESVREIEEPVKKSLMKSVREYLEPVTEHATKPTANAPKTKRRAGILTTRREESMKDKDARRPSRFKRRLDFLKYGRAAHDA